MHPGKEHRPDRDGFKDWNHDDHRRKFLEIDGCCWRKGTTYKGPLRFWGEWEPQSEVLAVVDAPLADGPMFICRPFYVVPTTYRDLQNTDPFVFEQFFYAVCRQETKFGQTQLRYLKQGSVILFGSSVRGQFALDTVFVVDSWNEYFRSQAVTQLHSIVPEAYLEVTIAALVQPKGKARCGTARSEQSLRLYSGATINNPMNGMYSFFPCQPAQNCPKGFARPVIAIPNVITDSLKQGGRLNRGIEKRRANELWNDVRKQVESADLWLGVRAEMPERRTARPPFARTTGE
jgi:hypothetical protein